MIHKLLLFLMITAAVLIPVQAAQPIAPSTGLQDHFIDQTTNLEYNVTPGLAIAGLEIRVPEGTALSFVINPHGGTTTTGTISYSDLTHTVSIGGDTNTYTAPIDPLHGAYLQHIGVAINGSDRGYYVDTEILTPFITNMAYIKVVNTTPITSFSLSSTRPVNVRVITESYEKAYTDLQPGIASDIIGAILDWWDKVPRTVQEYITFTLNIGSMILSLIGMTVYWLKFLFVDNLVLTVSLYFSVSMAYAALTARNIFKFFSKFFNDQMKMLNFIIDMWQKVISLLGSFIAIFKP